LRKISLLIILVFLFLTPSLIASTTIVKGNASQFKGKELELFTYSDYISLKKKDIGFTTIKENGAYNFNFEASEVKKVYVKIEDKITSFFVQPGEVYNLNISYSDEINKGRIYDKQLSLNFSFPVPTELNQQIGKFNQKFDAFIAENRALFEKRDHSIEVKLKAFQLKMLKEFESPKTNFITNYINYSIASTQSSLDVSYKKTDIKKGNNIKANLYLAYLDKKPILYSNPEYISFFKTFFKGEFKTLSLKVEGFDISKAINDKASYPELMLALNKYPFLENEEFRNLFMLNGLLEVSAGKYFTKANIINILSEVKANSKYPKHKVMAANIIDRITKKKFGVGSIAPGFELKNKDDEAISLNSFKGKPIYINFWTNWSIPSQKEMKIMQVLYKKYKGKIEFISICADNDFSKMTTFLSKNEGFNWPFLHVGKDKSILSNYSVATFPTYVLIDDNLKVVKFPAGRPGGTAERATEANIDKEIYELINQ
jgi:thiol-disulfide isomerase/thioredoxin